MGFISLVLLVALAGCAQPPVPRKATCHVERINEGPKDMTWCAEGRYVIFASSVTVGQVIQFSEFQENGDLQIHGYVEKRQ